MANQDQTTEIKTPKGLTKNGAGLPENNFSAPESLQPREKGKTVSIYDPSVDAYREVSERQARIMIENAEQLKKSFGSATNKGEDSEE